VRRATDRPARASRPSACPCGPCGARRCVPRSFKRHQPDIVLNLIAERIITVTKTRVLDPVRLREAALVGLQGRRDWRLNLSSLGLKHGRGPQLSFFTSLNADMSSDNSATACRNLRFSALRTARRLIGCPSAPAPSRLCDRRSSVFRLTEFMAPCPHFQQHIHAHLFHKSFRSQDKPRHRHSPAIRSVDRRASSERQCERRHKTGLLQPRPLILPLAPFPRRLSSSFIFSRRRSATMVRRREFSRRSSPTSLSRPLVIAGSNG
jgi:hypothetical protein